MLASMITSQHELLERKATVFPEEIEAYEQAKFLSWIMPLSVTLAFLLDAGLFYGFHFFCHPWLPILKEDDADEIQTLLETESLFFPGPGPVEEIVELIFQNAVQEILRKDKEKAISPGTEAAEDIIEMIINKAVQEILRKEKNLDLEIQVVEAKVMMAQP